MLHSHTVQSVIHEPGARELWLYKGGANRELYTISSTFWKGEKENAT